MTDEPTTQRCVRCGIPCDGVRCKTCRDVQLRDHPVFGMFTVNDIESANRFFAKTGEIRKMVNESMQRCERCGELEFELEKLKQEYEYSKHYYRVVLDEASVEILALQRRISYERQRLSK